MRAPIDSIAAPPFPLKATWFNVGARRPDRQRGRPTLLEFWDFCRPNSIRTLPYLKAWHDRYAEAGLQVIGVHASGFAPSEDPESVAAAVERLGITYPVMIDAGLALWQEYENLGWPARYLWTPANMLFDYHYGEGGYADTERAIRELLELDPDAEPALAPLRPEDVEGAQLALQSDDIEGPYSGPYEAGGVWGVFDGAGEVRVNGEPVTVDHPGAYELIRHDVSHAGTLDLSVGPGVSCLATCFTPGLVGDA